MALSERQIRRCVLKTVLLDINQVFFPSCFQLLEPRSLNMLLPLLPTPGSIVDVRGVAANVFARDNWGEVVYVDNVEELDINCRVLISSCVWVRGEEID
jgi:hypothetical protein